MCAAWFQGVALALRTRLTGTLNPHPPARRDTHTQARQELEGPDPKLALQQRSCAAVLDVVRAQGAYQPSHARLLGAALLQADFLAGPGGIPADRAVLAELVQLGWAELDTLPAGDAVHLLSAAAGLGTVTPEQLQTWLAAFNARGGLRAPRLFSSQRLELLEAALRLRQTGSGLALPPKLLGGALARLLAPGPVTRLSLAQLARAYTLARELGMWPTAEQHAAAAAAAAQRAEQGEFSAARVAQLLRLWAEMEREHVERNRQAHGRRQPEPWRSPISGGTLLTGCAGLWGGTATRARVAAGRSRPFSPGRRP